MAFCWSGKKIFLPNSEGKVRILSYPELEPVLHLGYQVNPGESTEFMLKGHTASCLTVELSPTGRYLATGGADSIISLFDTKDWICQRTVTRMVGPVKSISKRLILAVTFYFWMLIRSAGFTFDGSYVVGGCEEGGSKTTRRCQGQDNNLTATQAPGSKSPILRLVNTSIRSRRPAHVRR